MSDPRTPRIDMLEVMQDPELFRVMFRSPSWDRWKAALAALFALPMTDDQLTAYRHHTQRQTAPTAPCRQATFVIGRRGGKSRILALLGVYLGCFVNYAPYLAPGELAIVAILASSRKQARVTLRYVLGFLRHHPMLEQLIVRVDQDGIELTSGVMIEITTASIASPRGSTYAAVICDETAFWRTDDASANPDVEVINACRPGLATIPNSMLILASSPYAKRGALWNSFKRDFGREDARALVWRGTTLEMNSSLDPEIVADAFEDDPASAGAEYNAEFRTDIAAFISHEVVEACVEPGVFERPPLGSIQYTAFCDPSGGSGDSYTLCIGHVDMQRPEIVKIDCIREIQAPFNPSNATKEIADTLDRYKVHKVTGDAYAAEWVPDAFRQHGIIYEQSERNKSEIYLEALPLFNAGRVSLLDHRRMRSQLTGLERRTSRVGRDSVDHMPGGHDDLANVVCGAAVLLGENAHRLSTWANL